MAQQATSNISVIERYWTLVDKADKKFSKIRDLPYYERNRYDTYFYKVFKVYTQLWKFQQENRQKLVEAGLKRWEIGEIASRIAQLYYGQYMRTSEASYLSEAYIFYEAILSREYFKEGLCQELNLSNKQLRFLARFLMVCLVSNRREMVNHLVNLIQTFVDECKRTFQEADFKEWKLVVQEMNRFLKADNAFMNVRPLRYSLVLDPHPDALPNVTAPAGRRNLRLRDSILSSYNHNEVKFSELSVDSFRMLQCLEWEPSGSLYQSGIAKSSQNGEPGPCRFNSSQDISDPTLPSNPRKAVLYRPSVTQFIAVLATICEEVPVDGVLLVYLSASGNASFVSSVLLGSTKLPCPSLLFAALSCSVPAGSLSQAFICFKRLVTNSHLIGCANNLESTVRSFGSANLSQNQEKSCLQFGHHENGGLSCIYPSDLIPFTRKPLFIIVDSDSSEAFKSVSGSEKGERAALLLSPSSTLAVADSSCHPIGSLFTIFLTVPLQAFCLLIGVPGSDVKMDTYDRSEKLLSSSFNEWGLILAASETLDPVWAQILRDPFLRRFLLRFIFCHAALALCVKTNSNKEFHPKCFPPLPDSLVPKAASCQNAILQLANVFGASNSFIFSGGVSVSNSGNGDVETIPAS